MHNKIFIRLNLFFLNQKSVVFLLGEKRTPLIAHVSQIPTDLMKGYIKE